MRTKRNSYSWTSPYAGWRVERLLSSRLYDLYDGKIRNEKDFLLKVGYTGNTPQIMTMHNFITDRKAVLLRCRDYGINTIHGEDGFFPHYRTTHFDPLGFCWESSLTKMKFRSCKDIHRIRSKHRRQEWLEFPEKELPKNIRRPFILWPLQLIKDKVNKNGLNLSDWSPILEHLRSCLPKEIQLVVRPHPRGKDADCMGVAEFCQEHENAILTDNRVDLKTLLRNCNAVAGVNSSVLYEARLMFGKPVYVYGKSWFTNHGDLFIPIDMGTQSSLPNQDWLYDYRGMQSEYLKEYTDWYLYQLLSRQVRIYSLFELMDRLSFDSFERYGEEIFDDTVCNEVKSCRQTKKRVIRPGIRLKALDRNGSAAFTQSLIASSKNS